MVNRAGGYVSSMLLPPSPFQRRMSPEGGGAACLMITQTRMKISCFLCLGNTGSTLYSMKSRLDPDLDCMRLLDGKFLPGMFCMGNTLGSRDPCQVVAAAPAICGRELQGIMSWATGCILTGHTMVFTDLHSHSPWIKNVISAE
ncbi:hypothetical protein HJG60_015679 [Phyllostomus discolor]|uniref:Peptidase S1 domain-containing protein n=1 Tax=Phyllostomus discolor TaxID=89673 RepID=A0A834DQU9_9CHIR|nr:hypothetical protein HJG60_015679 [Phyllostomus discolor]